MTPIQVLLLTAGFGFKIGRKLMDREQRMNQVTLLYGCQLTLEPKTGTYLCITLLDWILCLFVTALDGVHKHVAKYIPVPAYPSLFFSSTYHRFLTGEACSRNTVVCSVCMYVCNL